MSLLVVKESNPVKLLVLSGYVESLVNIRGPLLRAIRGAGHEVLACAPEINEEIAAALRSFGVIYHSVQLERTRMNPIHDARFVLSFSRFLRQKRPDVFFGYNIKPVIYGSFAARLAGVPRVFSLIPGLGYTFGRETNKQRLTNVAARFLYRVALRSNQAVFFQNADDQNLFLKLKLLRDEQQGVRINGSGVDLELFAESPTTQKLPVFLLTARLIKEKGIVEYTEAARLLKSRYPHASFRLLGRLETHPSAIKLEQVERWRSEGIIEYLGATRNVRPYLVDTSVFVLPSYYREGTPLTVLEAMAVGRPIITTDMPGCRDTVIPGENGFLVPIKDAPRLAEAMERFILDPDLIPKMGHRSREIAVDKFDVNRVNAKMMICMGL